MRHANRGLAAIVSADVVGYSRRIGEDEAGTLEAPRAHRAELAGSERDLAPSFPSPDAALGYVAAIETGLLDS